MADEVLENLRMWTADPLCVAAAKRIEADGAEIERLRAALKDAREFVAGMVKPAAMPTTLTISSYHPCHALLDKIDAALGSTVEQSPRDEARMAREAIQDRDASHLEGEC